jgi:PGDYG protein
MQEMTSVDLSRDRASRRAMKRPVAVDVRFADADGRLATLEGDVSYHAGDAILTGVQGDRWPVARAIFLDSYEPVPPTPSGRPGRYRKRPAPILAKRMTEAFTVRVGREADPLTGNPGDWLIQYEPGRHGIVSAQIFDETYVLLD